MPPPLFPLLLLSQDDATMKQLCRGAFIYPASFSLAGTHCCWFAADFDCKCMQAVYMASCSADVGSSLIVVLS